VVVVYTHRRCFCRIEVVALSRAIRVFALVLAAAASAAHAQPGRIEMDVLGLDEPPSQAVQRMDEAMRRAAALRAGPREGPGAAPFIPEESLGTRGLAAPEPMAPDGFMDHEGPVRDHDDHHDKDDGDEGDGDKGGKHG
jgi:hypothetical protein